MISIASAPVPADARIKLEAVAPVTERVRFSSVAPEATVMLDAAAPSIENAPVVSAAIPAVPALISMPQPALEVFSMIASASAPSELMLSLPSADEWM